MRNIEKPWIFCNTGSVSSYTLTGQDKQRRNILLVIFTQAQIIEKLDRTLGETFAGLYEQYLPKVYRYISYRITDISTAEDLTSVVFEKALTKLKSYRPEKARFSTWIFTIARNTLTDHFRAAGKVRTVSLDSGYLSQPDNIEEVTGRTEDLNVLKTCLSRLSQLEQEIISLKFGAEMTNRQIASMLAMTESNIGVILFRAIRKLRNDFKGMQNG